MSKIRRLEEHRFIGVRSDMTVYDTQDPGQADQLSARVDAEELVNRNLISTFGPDTADEAMNRGFTPCST